MQWSIYFTNLLLDCEQPENSEQFFLTKKFIILKLDCTNWILIFNDKNMLILFQGSDDKNKVQEKMHKFAQRLSDDGEGGKPNYKGTYLFRIIFVYLISHCILIKLLSFWCAMYEL